MKWPAIIECRETVTPTCVQSPIVIGPRRCAVFALTTSIFLVVARAEKHRTVTTPHPGNPGLVSEFPNSLHNSTAPRTHVRPHIGAGRNIEVIRRQVGRVAVEQASWNCEDSGHSSCYSSNQGTSEISISGDLSAS